MGVLHWNALAAETKSNKSTILRRPELDEYGNKRAPDAIPKGKRNLGTNLTDREVLILGILSLFRASPRVFFRAVRDVDPDEWLKTSIKLWETNLDLSVKISIANTCSAISAAVFAAPPNHPRVELMARLFKSFL